MSGTAKRTTPANSMLAVAVALAALAFAALAVAGCATSTDDTPSNPAEIPEATLPDSADVDAWTLWTADSALRGANIWQKRIDPEIDGTEFLGPGPVGPPYTQADFDALASLGANYVNISHPGLYTEKAPFVADAEVVAHLDELLEMIDAAGMWAVISFRTGPGRTEVTFNRDEVGDWFGPEDLDETVWTDAEKQDAWVEMWRFTADRYHGHRLRPHGGAQRQRDRRRRVGPRGLLRRVRGHARGLEPAAPPDLLGDPRGGR